MKRILHLGASLLCLLLLVAAPIACNHAGAGTRPACASSMPASPAMPCCAAHPTDRAAQAAVDLELPSPDLLSLPLFRLPAASPSLGFRPPPVQAASPGAFRLPLRI